MKLRGGMLVAIAILVAIPLEVYKIKRDARIMESYFDGMSVTLVGANARRIDAMAEAVVVLPLSENGQGQEIGCIDYGGGRTKPVMLNMRQGARILSQSRPYKVVFKRNMCSKLVGNRSD